MTHFGTHSTFPSVPSSLDGRYHVACHTPISSPNRSGCGLGAKCLAPGNQQTHTQKKRKPRRWRKAKVDPPPYRFECLTLWRLPFGIFFFFFFSSLPPKKATNNPRKDTSAYIRSLPTHKFPAHLFFKSFLNYSARKCRY